MQGSGSDWHFMGVYYSHPACQSKPLECKKTKTNLALKPVFIVLKGPLFITCDKLLLVSVSSELHTLNGFIPDIP